MTEKPEYVLNFPRQKNTEIKKIGNNWYLYERFSKYDPEIKRSRKVSGKCLGKLTPDGLVPTRRRLVSVTANALCANQVSDVVLTLGHEDGILTLVYEVAEPELRRMVTHANGPVWTDSCVELFIQGRGEEYSNFEFSASGAFLAAHGRGRAGRVFYDDEARRHVHDSVTILENNNHLSRWRLEARLDLIALKIIDSVPCTVRLNAYKCGDGLRKPHFLSLFPIPSLHSTQIPTSPRATAPLSSSHVVALFETHLIGSSTQRLAHAAQFQSPRRPRGAFSLLQCLPARRNAQR